MAPVDHDGKHVSSMTENDANHFAEEDRPTLDKHRVEVYGYQTVGGGATGGGDKESDAAEARIIWHALCVCAWER